MRDLRVVFMGTPDFAVATLDALIRNKYKVVGVITAPDRPAGRGQSLRQSAVKRFALDHGLKVLQPTNLKNEGFLNELRDLKANLQIVVAFRMLPKAVWDMPEYGTFNLHASLLPDYRGAAPINWAIMKGESVTGVTTFFIDEKIDTGAIIIQEECTITKEDTAGTLHDRLMVLGAQLVLKTVELIAHEKVKVMPQKESETDKSAPKLTRENCEINWNLTGGEIYDHIRGLSPYPTAWTTLQNGEEAIYLKVFGASYIPQKHTFSLGQIVPHQQLRVAVDGGWIDLEEIQLPGKRKMASRDVLNGLKLESNAHVR